MPNSEQVGLFNELPKQPQHIKDTDRFSLKNVIITSLLDNPKRTHNSNIPKGEGDVMLAILPYFQAFWHQF